MYRSSDNYPLVNLVPAHYRTPNNRSAARSLAQKYIKKLGLSGEQQCWVEKSVIIWLQKQRHQPFAQDSNWFAQLQEAIGAMAEDGDELNARLAITLQNASRENDPSRWFRNQQLPPIRRSCMASKRFVRTLREYIREEWMPVWTLRNPHQPVTRNIWINRIFDGQYNVFQDMKIIRRYSIIWSSSQMDFIPGRIHPYKSIKLIGIELMSPTHVYPRNITGQIC
ncbi:hypothetical protein ACJU26_02470 [Acidithiobacillus sp. M4-SHS-6]|uniref:hypothetical protein n=1 Tax=Acidithiobacillus sp. M4-SHS-6 TaxID=3383024 RepID=UPI0039BE8C8C